ncbi:hypothetical protein BD779DRAFT_1449286, partial [Infundibulicybe gibba]
VERTEQPQTWRLLGEGVDGEPVEELVFTIAGILSEVDLPPVEEKPSVMPRKYRFLRQGVVITGLGSPTFEAAVDLTRDIYEVFQREFPEGKLEEWDIPRFQGNAALPFSNRYLTPTRDAPNMVHIPFDASIDPHGYLESMVKHGYVRGEENVVEYYIQDVNGGNSRLSFSRAKPQVFRVGDLVDVQVSFVVVELRQQKFKMVPVLRTIALVDGNFTQVGIFPGETLELF